MADGTNCWICGAQAESREHLIKASDIRGVFGSDVSQSAPLYLHNGQSRNQAVGGIKSKKLKYSALLCSYCNNNRTQPHDYAWERLSEYLRERRPPLSSGQVVKFNRVFPQRARASMLQVHLFFLKQFGCLIVEHGIPIALARFANSILNGVAHPDVHISFWLDLHVPGIKAVGRTDVHAVKLGEKVVSAEWFYFVDPIAVHVQYADEAHRNLDIQSWNPAARQRHVLLMTRATAKRTYEAHVHRRTTK